MVAHFIRFTNVRQLLSLRRMFVLKKIILIYIIYLILLLFNKINVLIKQCIYIFI